MKNNFLGVYVLSVVDIANSVGNVGKFIADIDDSNLTRTKIINKYESLYVRYMFEKNIAVNKLIQNVEEKVRSKTNNAVNDLVVDKEIIYLRINFDMSHRVDNHLEFIEIINLLSNIDKLVKANIMLYVGIIDDNNRTKKVDNLYFRMSHYIFLQNISFDKIFSSNIYEENLTKLDAKRYCNDRIFNNIYYVNTNKKPIHVARLQVNGIKGSFDKFIPILTIDENLKNLLCTQYSDINIKIKNYDKSDYVKTFFCLKEISENSIADFKRVCYLFVIKKTTIKLIQNIKKNLKSIKKADKEAIDNLIYFINHFESLNIIQYLLFLTLLNYSIEALKKSKIETDTRYLLSRQYIFNLRVNCEDFSDAILQIIENAAIHSNGGLFSYRILFGDLIQEYLRGNRGVEVRIVDFNSTLCMVDSFVEKLSKEGIKDTGAISLNDLFQPHLNLNNNLNKFYSQPENVTLHYGLKLFETVIENYKGEYIVSSSTNHDIHDKDIATKFRTDLKMYDAKKYDSHIPGTRYTVYLPILKFNIYSPSYVSMLPDFDDIMIKERWTCNNISVESKNLWEGFTSLNEQFMSVDIKSKLVKKFALKLQKRIVDKKLNVLNCVDIKRVDELEIVAKALIFIIQDIYRKNQSNLLALRFVVDSIFDINSFVRFFIIFYNRQNKCEAMKNSQILLIDRDLNEFLFSGEDLESSLLYLDSYLAINGYTNSSPFLLRELCLLRGVKKSNKYRVLSAPFDIMTQNFEKKVKRVLKSDIEDERLGGSLNDVHFIVGNQIHIGEHFYVFEVLQSVNYYTESFSYLIYKKIYDSVIKDKETVEKRILIVGYTLLSEKYLLNVKKISQKKSEYIKIDILIYDPSVSQGQNMFKYIYNILGRYDKIIIVTPISSTLNTFVRIIEDLIQQHDSKTLTIGENFSALINDVMCISLIVTRDKMSDEQDKECLEKHFWVDVDETNKIIETKFKHPLKSDSNKNITVHYLIDVKTMWLNPSSKCDLCYPDIKSDEKPILSNDRSSVIPMVMYSLKSEKDSSKTDYDENVTWHTNNVELLKGCVMYGHFQRKSSHFKFYIDSINLMNLCADSKSDLYKVYNDWIDVLRNKLMLLSPENKTSINIVVTPQHSTISPYLESLLSRVFENTPILMEINHAREYRENIRTKYGFIRIIYDNLEAVNDSSIPEFNFYYIDETITTGHTFYRLKSLVASTLPDRWRNNHRVQVNLFKHIILLYDRSSNYTKYNFVNDLSAISSFFRIPIPVQRNHRDACSICKEQEENMNMISECSSNQIYHYWYRKVKNLQVIDAENYRIDQWHNSLVPKSEGEWKSNFDSKDVNDNRNINTITERYYRRLKCSCDFYEEISHKSKHGYNKEELSTFINDKLNEYTGDIAIEWKISYIKVISRPFFIYRKTVLEAVFSYMLEELETVITKIESNHSTNELHLNLNLLSAIIVRIFDLKSNYAIDKLNLKRLYNIKNKIEGFEHRNLSWHIFLISRLKRVITNPKNGFTTIKLESILLDIISEQAKLLDVDKFYINLFLENTSLIRQFVNNNNTENTALFDEILYQLKEYTFLEEDPYKKFKGRFNDTVDNIKSLFVKEKFINSSNFDKSKKNEKYDVSLPILFNNLLNKYVNLAEIMDIFINNTKSKRFVSIIAYNQSADSVFTLAGNRKIHKDIVLSEAKKTYQIENKDDELDFNMINIGDTLYFLGDSYFEKESIEIIKEEPRPQYMLIKFILSDENHTVYIVIKTNEQIDIMMLWKLRIFLAFRYELCEMLRKDLESGVFGYNIQLYNELIKTLGHKAGNHTSYNNLINHFKLNDFQNTFDLELKSKNAELVSDAIISKIYVEILILEYFKKDAKDGMLSNYKFSHTPKLIAVRSILNETKKITDNMKVVSYKDGQTQKCGKLNIKSSESQLKNSYLVFVGMYETVLKSFMISIIGNAIKYGLEENNMVSINVTVDENDYLIFENKFLYGNIESHRGGITQKTIQKFYNHTKKWLKGDLLDSYDIVFETKAHGSKNTSNKETHKKINNCLVHTVKFKIYKGVQYEHTND